MMFSFFAHMLFESLSHSVHSHTCLVPCGYLVTAAAAGSRSNRDRLWFQREHTHTRSSGYKRAYVPTFPRIFQVAQSY